MFLEHDTDTLSDLGFLRVTLTSETPSKKAPCCFFCHEVADRLKDPTTIFCNCCIQVIVEGFTWAVTHYQF